MCKVRAEGRAWREAGEPGRALSPRCLSGAEWLECVWRGKAWSEALPKSKLALGTTTASPAAVGKDTIMGEAFPEFFWSFGHFTSLSFMPFM